MAIRIEVDRPKLKITLFGVLIFVSLTSMVLALMAMFAMKENVDENGTLVYTSVWTLLSRERQNFKAAGQKVNIPFDVYASTYIALIGSVLGMSISAFSICIAYVGIRRVFYQLSFDHKWIIAALVTMVIGIILSSVAVKYAWQVTDPEWYAYAMSKAFTAR